jgi:hypothetical protein
MNEDLRQNQIVPAAQPLDTFIRPATPQAGGVPQNVALLPRGAGIETIQTGGTSSVQGSNRFAELAQALAPFNQRLTTLAAEGMDQYAKGEYEKGRNLAVRAQILANQQREQSSLEYAQETRSLTRKDPAMGQLMAQLNPFQTAGFQNQMSRVAATEAQALIRSKYEAIPNAHLLDVSDPEITKAKVSAVNELLQKYQLNEATPGFLDYVLPEINQGWDQVTQLHRGSRQKYLADMLPRTAAALIVGRYQQARQTGVVEWTEFSPSGAPTKRSAALATDPEGWQRGLSILMSKDLDDMVAQSMQPGIAAQLRVKASEAVAAQAGVGLDSELMQLLGKADGDPGPDGRRIPMGALYGPDMLETYSKFSKITYEEKARAQETAMQAASAELINITSSLEDGPERSAAIQGWLDKHSRAGLDSLSLLEMAERSSKAIDNIAARAFDPGGMDGFLGEMEALDISQWNPAEARDMFDRLRATVAPEQRAEYDKRFGTIFRRFQEQADDAPLALTQPIIDAKIKANLRLNYPGTATEAALRGANITDMLAFGDANVARSAQLQLSALRGHVYARLGEARKAKGAALTASEITRVTTDAVNEYGTKDKEGFKTLFPGSAVSGVPSVSGAKPQPPIAPGAGGAAAKPPPGRAIAPASVFPSGQLDNIPNRSQRLKDGSPVLDNDSTVTEIGRVLNGGRPSNAVQRAAKDAGLTVGQFLLRQAGAYPSIKIPEPARQKLLRDTKGPQAISRTIESAGSKIINSQLIASAGNWFLNAVTGSGPAMAQGQPARLRFAPRTAGMSSPVPSVFTGGGSYVGVLPNGYSRDRRTQTLTGIKGHPSYDADHGVGNDHVHHGAYDQKDAMALARHLKAKGYPITEFKPWGRVGGHKDPGHYNGSSFDVPVPTSRHREVLREIDNFYASRNRSSNRVAVMRGYGKVGDSHKWVGGDLVGDVTYYTGSGGSDGSLGGSTANGEIFTGKKMTAAVQWGLRDRFLNRWVIVESLDTGRTARVWVNDTGQMGGSKTAPRDRVLDLSPVAYRKLKGSLDGGVGRIRLRLDPNQSGRP